MIVRFHPHALERLTERGATEEEICATVLGGESFPAKFGPTGFRRNVRFDSLWRDRHYAIKQVEAFVEFTDVYQIEADFKAKVETEFKKMILQVTGEKD